MYLPITQYGSTVFIGMAMGGSPFICFHFQFQFELSSKDIKVENNSMQKNWMKISQEV